MTKRPRQFTLAFSLLFFLLLPSSLFAAGLQLADISSMIQQGKTAEARVEIDKQVTLAQGDNPQLFLLEVLRTESFLKEQSFDSALNIFGATQNLFDQLVDTTSEKPILDDLRSKMGPVELNVIEQIPQLTLLDELQKADQLLESVSSVGSDSTIQAKVKLEQARVKSRRGLFAEAENILRSISNANPDEHRAALLFLNGILARQGKFTELESNIDQYAQAFLENPPEDFGLISKNKFKEEFDTFIQNEQTKFSIRV